MTTYLGACAFIDDTIWIARSKLAMEKILELALEFYDFNDIQINDQKTKVIAINQDENTNTSFTLNNQNIDEENQEPYQRYLGIFINSEGTSIASRQVIKKEIQSFHKAIRHKTITEKQAHYLIHNVLFPAILYRTQACFIPNSQCEKWN